MSPALNYTWSQALNDLSQIAPIVTLTGFFLFAIVADLVLKGGSDFDLSMFRLSRLTGVPTSA